MAQPENTHLNLARKWRPQTFDTVIGQDIPVRMLKNSLYLQKFFPVYLFAGQRGCGKTTTARIFAAAVNCAQLPTFQQDPAQAVPCLTCSSCLAMSNGSHPDFIEIDAASHTGVDNVRNIIESSSYMPLAGKKKVYLIDEAHMLSKAAFNAFLKLLEEPPKTVMFMLATTETNKIPATVLSRCFQLMFPPIAHAALRDHLMAMCAKEGVIIDPAAVDLLLQETEGSARDAINLLERVRFSSDQISEELVLTVLGKISNSTLIGLMDAIAQQQPVALIEQLQAMHFTSRSPVALWDGLVHLCKTLIWIKYGVTALAPEYEGIRSQLQAVAGKCSRNRLHAMLTLLWQQESTFNQTSKKHAFLETVLLQLCDQVNLADVEDILTGKPPQGGSHGATGNQKVAAPVSKPAAPLPQAAQPVTQATPAPAAPPTATDGRWHAFVAEVGKLPDPLLASIMSQAVFVSSDQTAATVTVALSANSSFFKSKIEETTALWQPILVQVFNGCRTLLFHAGNPATQPLPPRERVLSSAPNTASTAPKAPTPAPAQAARYASPKNDEFLVIKDPNQWPVASLLLSTFSGKIKKVPSNQS